MVWIRAIVGIALSALAIFWLAGGFLQLSGLWHVSMPSAPGVAPSDLAALHRPYESLASRRPADFLAQLAEPDRAQAQAALPQLESYVPQTPPLSHRLVGWSRFFSGGDETLSGVDEYTYPEGAIRAQTALTRSGAQQTWRLSSFHVDALSNAQLAQRAFTLSGKPPAFIAIVLATALIPVLTWLTALAALIKPRLPLRWLWFIFIIFCIGTLRLNSFTGETSVQPLSFQILGGSYFSADGLFEPYTFGVSFPLGALLFWIFARSRAPQISAPAEVASPSG